jgi:hypothetical protein
MKQRRRVAGAWSKGNEAAYSVVEWEDSTGDAEVWEHDSAGQLLRRFVYTSKPDAEAGALLIEFAPDGTEISRERISGPVRGW